MISKTFTELNIEEIRNHVRLELDACERVNKPWFRCNKQVSRQLDILIRTYVSLNGEIGIAPYGDMLPHLGWPGRVIHELFCTQAGMWEAFRKLVERSYDLPYRTSLMEGGVFLNSLPERFVYQRIVAIPGVTRVETHPVIPSGSGRTEAAFLVWAATGSTVYVEVATVSSQADAERSLLGKDLRKKMELYRKAGIDPVVIWGDQAASPRVLAERLNEISARLNLPTRPPAPLAWYEEID